MNIIKKIKRYYFLKKEATYPSIPVFNPYGPQDTLFPEKVAKMKEVVKKITWLPK